MSSTIGVAATPLASRERARRGRFFVGMSPAIIVTVFAGFAPTYYIKGYFQTPELSTLVHLHGLVFTAWILLFAVQSSLVAAHRTDLHRFLGGAGVLVAAAVVALGTATALGDRPEVWRAWYAVNPSLLATLARLAFSNVGNMMIFGILVAGALCLRRRPDAHKRLMLVACMALLDAPIARLLDDVGPAVLAILMTLSRSGLFNLIVLPFFAALVLYDFKSMRSLHPATLWGGALLFFFQFAFLLILDNTAAMRALLEARG